MRGKFQNTRIGAQLAEQEDAMGDLRAKLEAARLEGARLRELAEAEAEASAAAEAVVSDDASAPTHEDLARSLQHESQRDQHNLQHELQQVRCARTAPHVSRARETPARAGRPHRSCRS